MMRLVPLGFRLIRRTLIFGWMAWLFLVPVAHSQQSINIPNFWDPQERFIKPNVTDLQRLRFLTTTDFPPFSFIDKDKRLIGFHVDLARAICAELEVMPVCQIQAVPFGELEEHLQDGGGDAIIAGLAPSVVTRQKFAFSRPYFRLPARFLSRADSDLDEPLSERLAGLEVGVVDGTSHAAMAVAKFGDLRLRLFATQDAAIRALQRNEIVAVFGDALSMTFWMQANRQAAQCCKFVGGPYLSETYLGPGLSIAVPRENQNLKRALDYALRSINDKAIFAELYLRYFPIGLF